MERRKDVSSKFQKLVTQIVFVHLPKSQHLETDFGQLKELNNELKK
jgi:hypothetical protein